MEDIDFEALRDYLMDYCGTASMYNPASVMELSEVETASPNKLVEIAIKNNIDLDDFISGLSH